MTNVLISMRHKLKLFIHKIKISWRLNFRAQIKPLNALSKKNLGIVQSIILYLKKKCPKNPVVYIYLLKYFKSSTYPFLLQ